MLPPSVQLFHTEASRTPVLLDLPRLFFFLIYFQEKCISSFLTFYLDDQFSELLYMNIYFIITKKR